MCQNDLTSSLTKLITLLQLLSFHGQADQDQATSEDESVPELSDRVRYTFEAQTDNAFFVLKM